MRGGQDIERTNALGTKGARFVYVHFIGAGGFGEVHRYTMTTPGCITHDVARKVLRPGVRGPNALERLQMLIHGDGFTASEKSKDEASNEAAIPTPAIGITSSDSSDCSRVNGSEKNANRSSGPEHGAANEPSQSAGEVQTLRF